ncbi:MAG: hypothetical protein A2073_07305 [Deltaproteobacteria bacterium GWC2_42_11]|nr:MAG: hypothetical protein A2073_07305 [Deltaproteobacteria bacterium GWC2_42_11]
MSNQYIGLSAIIFLFLTLINIPFGMVRSTVPRFSRKWGRCIYIPILLGIVVRRLTLASYKLIPLFIAATILGQILGGSLKGDKQHWD